MQNVLITGASRGIGLEFVRQYDADGWRIFACCRTPGQAGELNDIAARSEGRVSVHQLDVDQAASVAALKAELGEQPLDVLLNNAGIMGQRNAARGDIDYDAWQEAMVTNVMGPMRMAEAFADNVAASAQKKLITISSRMGSIGETQAPNSIVYRSSKAAVNMVMKILANDLGAQGVIVTSFHPGWVRTDMGGSAADISAEQSAGGIRQVIAGLGAGDNGAFRNYDGGVIQW
ncbi:MAG: SDR family oxidoreductase [Alphaproteobacteria bacterium]|nr:SDR family oxidoreductase [Alphaproteobacteria bacterium]